MGEQFLIVSQADDLHALAVHQAVRSRGLPCHIVECDKLSGRESINFSVSSGMAQCALLRTSQGELLDVASISAIWWRRFKFDQELSTTGLTDVQMSLINNDCVGALVGSLQNAFAGRWISSPPATEFASNKANQLAAAKSAGFRIPDTVITQSPSVVRGFYESHNGRVIVKPMVGTRGPLLFTQLLRKAHIEEEAAIRACPAIYQEYIPGTKHIRLNCFGDRSFAGLIETEEVDWRPNLEVPISRWTVPHALHTTTRRVLDTLGLEMGIIDLKMTTGGDVVWLEVNPQGQFLFLEGLTGEPLTEHFATYFTQSSTLNPPRPA
jgi:glutathione synthase/RimK-type ligase-like ATP-grasp enzyme